MPILVEDAWLPAVLTVGPMSDDAFEAFVNEHPDLFFEMTASGELIIMPPAHSKTGARNAKIVSQLNTWAEQDEGGTAFDSSTGYVLPNRARRSPDASWVANDRIRSLPPREQDRYYHLAPDFAIDLRSDTDRLTTLREKMREYTDNGTPLAWLIDPMRRVVEIYRTGREPEVRKDPRTIEGEGPVAGFVLNLQRVLEPIG